MAEIEKTLDGSDGGLQLNAHKKVLPGYHPVGQEEALDQQAQYLQEEVDATEQMQEQNATEADAQRETEEEMLHDKSAEEELVPAEDESAPEFESDIDGKKELQEVEQEQIQRRVQRNLVIEQNSLEERHRRIMAKLDAALMAERQRANDLYAVENTKKNTLDYALQVYGDNADVNYIMESAAGAKEQVSPDMTKMSNRLSMEIDNFIHDKDQVLVASQNGPARVMDREVAEVMAVYTSKSHKGFLATLVAGLSVDDPTAEAQYAGLSDDIASKYEQFVFTRDEEAKLRELQAMMAENDKAQRRFEEKTSEAMPQTEYDEARRERRLKEYGDPTYGMQYDYLFANEGVYKWNGRQLPSAMSSNPEMAGLAVDNPTLVAQHTAEYPM